ncbi:putative NAD binding NADP oxidoreductase coenzyme F420-dependent [Aspergillus granulosus]|uniref:NAD binding NADP oxidoreductase coenzyme F420-dependent n=1 Tax=Aspergillus granulosus TaxID=176169 RepID=A0ABR4H7K8_9EURO
MRLGFIGFGVMGVPMARNLARNFPLTVWNRSPSKHALLKETGAQFAISETPAKVIAQSDITFVMLFNASAIESILAPDFFHALRDKTLVNSSSIPVEFNEALAWRVRVAGGDFLEMPVSGSRVPAEQGQLVGLMAGDSQVADRIRPFVRPLTRSAVYCGPIGSGLKAKYAVNTLLITLTVGLSESVNLARAQDLDLKAFEQVLEACPMASAYSKLKAAKVRDEDWSAQASLKDCYNSTQLIESAAAAAGTRSPLMQLCGKLYKEAIETGLGEEDMISIAKTVGKKAGHRLDTR